MRCATNRVYFLSIIHFFFVLRASLEYIFSMIFRQRDRKSLVQQDWSRNGFQDSHNLGIRYSTSKHSRRIFLLAFRRFITVCSNKANLRGNRAKAPFHFQIALRARTIAAIIRRGNVENGSDVMSNSRYDIVAVTSE